MNEKKTAMIGQILHLELGYRHRLSFAAVFRLHKLLKNTACQRPVGQP
jgi:hypothetical protein